jgi:hypothetical protein
MSRIDQTQPDNSELEDLSVDRDQPIRDIPPMPPNFGLRETDLIPSPSFFQILFRRSYIRKRWPGMLD